MIVIRRFDAILEPTKQDVLKMKKQLDENNIVSQDAALNHAAGKHAGVPMKRTIASKLDNLMA